MTQPEPTQRLYSAETGAPLDVPVSQVADAVRSGSAGFAPGTVATVRDDRGELRQMPAEEAARFLASTYLGGAGTNQDFARREELRANDTIGGKAEAFAGGAFNASLLGFGDAALAAVDRREAQRLALVREANPGAAFAGEAAGMIAPALLSGGSSLAASGGRGAGVVARGAGAVGAPAAILSEGAGLVGRGAQNLATRLGASEGGALASAIRMGTTGAVEGSVYGLGAETSRAMIHNEPLTAEKLLAAATHGGLMGGALGGGLSLLGSGGKALISSMAAKREAVAVERAAARAEALAAEVSPVPKTGALDRLADRMGLSPEKLAAYAEEKAAKSLVAGQGSQKMIAKFEALGEEARARVGKFVLETVPEKLGKPVGSRVEMAALAETERKAVGERIGALTKELDATGAKVDRTKIADRLLAEVEAPMAANRVYSGAEREVSALRERIASGGEMSFQELHRMRADVDKIGAGIADTKVRKELLGDVRKVLEEELQVQGTAAVAPGAEWAARWNAAKGDYQAIKWVADATKKSSVADKANASIGLREMLGAVQGANAGATAGALIAGAPGALVGGALFGGASAVLNNQIRRFGDQAVAVIADAAAKHGAAAGIAKGVDVLMDRAAAKLTSPGASKLAQVAGNVGGAVVRGSRAVPARQIAERAEGERSAKARQADRERAFAASTAAVAEFVVSGGAPARNVTAGLSPQTAQAVQGAALHVARWLQTKIPKPVGGDPLRAGAGGVVPPSEQDKFLRYARAANDPLTVIQDAANGKLTIEAAEAVRACYPRLAGEITGKILGELATKPNGLTYKNALHIGALMGTPTHELLKPGSISTLQATYATGGMAPPSTSTKPVNLASEVESKTQRINQR